MNIKKPPAWLIAIIIVSIAALIYLFITVVPLQMKETHARNFAKTQCEYMQTNLKKGTSVAKVKAVVQANITEEHAGNTDTDFTIYTINIDEENKTCRIDIELAYGKTYEKFSSKELAY